MGTNPGSMRSRLSLNIVDSFRFAEFLFPSAWTVFRVFVFSVDSFSDIEIKTEAWKDSIATSMMAKKARNVNGRIVRIILKGGTTTDDSY